MSSRPRARRYPVLRLVWLLPAVIAGCSTPGVFDERDGGPDRHVDIDSIPDAVPRVESRSRSGNPSSYVVHGKRYYVMSSSSGYTQRGIASWYGSKFHGRRTSSGEPYDMYAMTAAHKSLPLPTYVRVTNLENGRAVVVKVNDRGPFHQNRIIDLSYVAAAKLGITRHGTGLVEVSAIDPRRPEPRPRVVETSAPVETTAPLDHSPRIYIQVGAFGMESNARRLQERLERSLNRVVRVQSAVSGGNSVFRVQVGPVTSVEAADAVSLQLTDLGMYDTRVVID